MKFIWYLTITKRQIEFENEDNALIWPGVMVPDRREWISLKYIYIGHDQQQNTV